MKRILVILAGVLAFVVLTAESSSCGDSGPSQAAAPDKPAASATAAPAAKAPQVLLDVSGSGAKKTNSFKAGGNWDINWSAKDSSGFGACYMGVAVYDANSNAPVGIAVNQSVKESAQDVDHEHRAGTYYLDINAASCDWHVTVNG